MELKKIVKSTSFLVLSKVFQFIIGIVRSKLAAVYIGTTGIGVFTQVNYLVNMISNTALLSMNDGLVKQIAQNKTDPKFREILRSIFKSYSVLILITTLIAVLLGIVFSKQLTIFFLGDVKYEVYYLIGLSCLPVTMANSISFALLKSHKATRYISRSNIASSVITVIIFVPLILLFKTTGAVISVAVNYLVLLIINNYQARKHILNEIGIRFIHLFNGKTNKSHTKELLNFAIFGATSGFILIVSESICRSIVVNKLGIEKLGVYSPITSWGNLFQGFILTSLSIYLFPRISEAKDNREISGIINDFFRLITFVILPFIIIAIPIRRIIIPIFYSGAFIEASIYLPWHFIGLMFYSWFYILTQVMTPIGKIKQHGILTIGFSIFNILVVYFFTSKFGLYGWMLKFIFGPVVFFIIYLLFINKAIKFKIHKSNVILMSYAITMTFVIIMLDNMNIRYIFAIGVVLLLVFFLKPSEKALISAKIKAMHR